MAKLQRRLSLDRETGKPILRAFGQLLQRSTTDLMITPMPELIVYIYNNMPLLIGDVIVPCTPSGAGAKRNPPRWLKPSDVAEVEIGGIGILRNSVEAAI